jgi:hypothetical protein
MTDRKGQVRPWTYKHLLTLMQAEVGWAPAHPNYSGYELGKSIPEPNTLAKFVKFWQAHGVAGPDLTPPKPADPPPDLASALSALAAELAAIRLEREAWRRGVVEVLRAYEAGQVPVELLDALAPRLPADARR